jgi:hypothetical protein
MCRRSGAAAVLDDLAVPVSDRDVEAHVAAALDR